MEEYVAEGGALLDHLESSFGRLEDESSAPESLMREEFGVEFSILCFAGAAGIAFVTFGVSRHLLRAPEAHDSSVSQELVLVTTDVDYAFNALATVGDHVLEQHVPIRVGERHHLEYPTSDRTISGVMGVPDPVAQPFDAASPAIEFVRLVPLTDSEAAYVSDHGWRRLAEAWAAAGVDLSDLRRPAVV